MVVSIIPHWILEACVLLPFAAGRAGLLVPRSRSRSLVPGQSPGAALGDWAELLLLELGLVVLVVGLKSVAGLGHGVCLNAGIKFVRSPQEKW